jgi:predicted metalloprotease with PDZ domain
MPRAGGKLDDLLESASLGGRDVAVATQNVAGAPLTVAVQGKWSFTPAELLARVGRIVAAEHAYWGERTIPFLVTVAPTPDAGPGAVSYTGTGRGDAFSILSTPNLDLAQATRVLAHEYMHHWVAALLGGTPETDEARDYWFSEGFDDYLTARVLLRSGIWTPAEWFANKNEVLLRYATSPARGASAAEIAAGFWKNEDVGQVSYDRGHLLALLIDGRIREATQGRLDLDDVLRVQRRLARHRGPTAAALLPLAVRKVAGIDVRPEIERYAVRGERVVLPFAAFSFCGWVGSAKRAGFTRGFDIAATEAAAMTIHGVDPSGPAYAAGMRDGMKLLKREAGTLGDSTREIAYRVADKGSERVIRYRPEGRERFDVQQVTPDLDAAEHWPSCRRILAGRR